MPPEIVFSLFFGTCVGIPVGYFFKAAMNWRREAKRQALPAPEVRLIPAQQSPSLEPRLERLLEKVGQRLEAIEDRLEFTERLLDARTKARPELEARRGPSAVTTE